MIGKISISQLDEYVRECDARGGIWTDECKAFVAGFELEAGGRVDRTLDPFSTEYFDQQIALYREISGRDVKQSENELHPFDFDLHYKGSNPYNSQDTATMGHHVAATALALRMANIPRGGKVLDMGVGVGLSSETMAFCGADVTAVDINPDFVKLLTMRAEKRAFHIDAKLSNFDDYEDVPEKYDLALFVGALHHGLKPWEILSRVGRFVKPDGKIALVMEPIQKTWWPYWGIRMDHEAAYVARKYGWFESGWSEQFLQLMFNRMGWHLQISRHDPELFAGGFFCLGNRGSGVVPAQFPYIPVIERGTPLHFSSDDIGPKYLSFGWSTPERFGTWSNGSSAGLLLNLPAGDAWTLTVEVHPMVSQMHPRQLVHTTVAGILVGTSVLEGDDATYRMEKSSTFELGFTRKQIGDPSSKRPCEVVFDLPLATRPDYIGRGSDPRKIGLGIVSLRID